jgi:hypothetical protein
MDGRAHLGEFVADVPVKGIRRFRRVHRDERYAIRPRLVHQITMAGRR